VFDTCVFVDSFPQISTQCTHAPIPNAKPYGSLSMIRNSPDVASRRGQIGWPCTANSECSSSLVCRPGDWIFLQCMWAQTCQNPGTVAGTSACNMEDGNADCGGGRTCVSNGYCGVNGVRYGVCR
jgi:hypothetical protein